MAVVTSLTAILVSRINRCFSLGSSIFGIQLDLGLYEIGPLFISPGDVEQKDHCQL